ncbi:MAG: hypothetical protein E7178_00325 [Erysipelotrichaceae bacterium]|jgi:hypothetical protein|nr:hypothetical protein [Erysipelotrichaceae bacterium]
MADELDPKPVYNNDTRKALLLVAFIFMILGTVGLAILLIPLAWCIPMTIHCYQCYNNNEKPSVAFGVCSLLFVSLIGGILLIVAGAMDD